MLGRRSREGLIVLYIHELADGVTETLTARKHIDKGGRLHLTERVVTVKDHKGDVLCSEVLPDVVTLLVG